MPEIYPQSQMQQEQPVPTLTVGQLIAQLQLWQTDLPVVFQTPQYGVFGGGMTYAISAAEPCKMERREIETPDEEYVDDDTGETVTIEGYTEIEHPWLGVIIK